MVEHADRPGIGAASDDDDPGEQEPVSLSSSTITRRLEDALRIFIETSHTKPTEIELADAIVRRLQTEPDYAVSVNGQIWRYDTCGIYLRLEDEVIKNIILNLDGIQVQKEFYRITNHKLNNILQFVKVRLEDSKFFDDALDGIAVADGFLAVSMEGLEYQEHSSEQRQRHLVPVPLKEDADCSSADDFVLEILQDGSLMNLFYEIAGVALMGQGTDYHRAYIFSGSGSNGKGTLIKLLQKLFPFDFCSSVPPNEWKNDYHRFAMKNSRLNVVGELPKYTVSDLQFIKGMISGDTIDVRPVKGNSFSYKPKALHIFATNSLQDLPERGPNIERRFKITPFTKRFTDEIEDQFIVEKMWDQIKVGLLNRAIQGYDRVKQQGGFSEPEAVRIATANWLNRLDPVQEFIRDCVEQVDDPSSRIAAQAMYQACCAYCNANGYPPPTSAKDMNKCLKLLGLRAQKSGNVYWIGVKLLQP
jgi:P4 family phage/plasmid primase-like protien